MITLRSVCALLQNTATPRREVVVSHSYRSGLTVIASYSSRFGLVKIVIASYICYSKMLKLLLLLKIMLLTAFSYTNCIAGNDPGLTLIRAAGGVYDFRNFEEV